MAPRRSQTKQIGMFKTHFGQMQGAVHATKWNVDEGQKSWSYGEWLFSFMNGT